MASHGERKNKDRERQTKEIKVLLFLLYISSLFTLRFCEFLFRCIFSSYLEKKRAEEGGGQCYFFAREEKKNCPRKKLKTNQKLTENDCFFPEKIFENLHPRNQKQCPRKKNQNCARENHKVPEKNQKEWARNFENGRENCQKSGKKWARKPIFAREKSQNKPKILLLGHFCRFSGKKKNTARGYMFHWVGFSE